MGCIRPIDVKIRNDVETFKRSSENSSELDHKQGHCVKVILRKDDVMKCYQGTLKIGCGCPLLGFLRQYDQLGDNVLMLWELDVACCFDTMQVEVYLCSCF